MNLSMLNPLSLLTNGYVMIGVIAVVAAGSGYAGLHYGNLRCDAGKFQAANAELAGVNRGLVAQHAQLNREYQALAAKLAAQQAQTATYQAQRSAAAARADSLQQEINREQFSKTGTAVCSADLDRPDFSRLYDAASAGGLPAAAATAARASPKG